MPLHTLLRLVGHGVLEQDDVSSLLGKHGLYRLIQLFKEQEVDMDALLTLTRDDLAELGVADPKDIAKLLKLIKMLSSVRSGTTVRCRCPLKVCPCPSVLLLPLRRRWLY